MLLIKSFIDKCFDKSLKHCSIGLQLNYDNASDIYQALATHDSTTVEWVTVIANGR